MSPGSPGDIENLKVTMAFPRVPVHVTVHHYKLSQFVQTYSKGRFEELFPPQETQTRSSNNFEKVFIASFH
jgi:hypothetical protein